MEFAPIGLKWTCIWYVFSRLSPACRVSGSESHLPDEACVIARVFFVLAPPSQKESWAVVEQACDWTHCCAPQSESELLEFESSQAAGKMGTPVSKMNRGQFVQQVFLVNGLNTCRLRAASCTVAVSVWG